MTNLSKHEQCYYCQKPGCNARNPYGAVHSDCIPMGAEGSTAKTWKCSCGHVNDALGPCQSGCGRSRTVNESPSAISSNEQMAREAHEHYQPQIDDLIAENNRLRAALTKIASGSVNEIRTPLGPLHAAGIALQWEIDAKIAREALSGDSSAVESRKPCSICGSTEHSHLHCYGSVHETSCRYEAAVGSVCNKCGRIHDFGPNRCAECQTPRLCGVERECLRNRYVRPSVQETSARCKHGNDRITCRLCIEEDPDIGSGGSSGKVEAEDDVLTRSPVDVGALIRLRKKRPKEST